MAEVKNLTNRLVSIRKNDGRTWHLPPKFYGEIDDALIMNNAQVKKLEDKHVISVQSAKEETTPVKQPTKQKTVSGKPSKT
jgi:hypothetical protein